MIYIENNNVVAVTTGVDSGKTIFATSDREPTILLTERKIIGMAHQIYITDEDWKVLKEALDDAWKYRNLCE